MARNRPFSWLTIKGIPNAAETVSDVSVARIGPLATILPADSISMCVYEGGMSSTWCVTSTIGSSASPAR